MRRPALLFSCLIALCAIQSPRAAAANSASGGLTREQAQSDNTPASSNPAQRRQTEPLKASIEHSETLPALPEEDRKIPDAADLQALTPDNIWTPIPSWYAGTWHHQSETITYLYSFKTGTQIPVNDAVIKNDAERTYGMQTDKNGQVWDFLKVPFSYKAGVNGGVSFVRLSRIDPLRTTEAQVVRRVVGSDTTVVGSEVISHQKETINDITQLEDGVLHVNGSMKMFDADGQPQLLKRSEMIMQRIKPYQRVDTMDGLDLKKLFAEFLKKSGHEDWIPVM